MKTSTFKKILHCLAEYKMLLATIGIFSIVSALCTIIAPLLVGNILDMVLGYSHFKFVQDLISLLFIYLLLLLANLILNYALSTLATKLSRQLRQKLFEKIHHLPLSHLDHTSYGSILNHFSVDVDNVSNSVIQSFSKITVGVVTIVCSIYFMLRINLILTLLLILVSPIMYAISRFITNRTKSFFRQRAEQVSHLNALAEEMITGQKTIKDFNYESTAQHSFESVNKNLYKTGVKAQFYSSLTNPSTRFVSNLAYIVIGIIGCILAKLGQITIGNISSFLLYTNVFTRPFNEITSVLSEIQAGLASADRIFTFLEQEEEMDTSSSLPITSLMGHIDFKHVDFSYTPSKPFITNFNLQVEKGETIAIVGKTGSGKTTIVNLLLRYYEITKGDILIDGLSIKQIPKDFLRKHIGVVLQDTKLFTGTIKENIAYGKENATDEEIIQAAKMAHAHFFIEKLPKGYDTYISNEDMFSAGEIQLLTIARIMLLNPPILILDEATSNVDLLTESHIQEAFHKLIQGSTSFVIAHRLSTIQQADRILFIENGNIVEQGTHESLLQKKGYYYSLYHSQFA